MSTSPVFSNTTFPYVFQLKTRLLSASVAPELLYWVGSLLEAGAKNLVIDMREVLFMDSSGLGSLVIAHNRVQKADGKLALCCLGGQARMLFELSGMEKVFEVYATPEDFEKALTATQTHLLNEPDTNEHL